MGRWFKQLPMFFLICSSRLVLNVILGDIFIAVSFVSAKYSVYHLLKLHLDLVNTVIQGLMHSKPEIGRLS